MLAIAILLTIVSALLWAGVFALAFYGIRQLMQQDKERSLNPDSRDSVGVGLP